jgi:uncharacterized protein YqjF (DUF2071 family)
MSQTWSQLTFLHWAVAPERVAGHLPPGVWPDTFDGMTYVGLLPFVMRRSAAWRGPGLPYVGSFCETNVRLYSVDRQGRRSVVFLSLDASRLAAVVAARCGPRLPYAWSRMRVTRDAARVTACRRRWPGPRGITSRIAVRVGPRIAAGPLDGFLTARWGLHLLDRRGRTRYWPNAHEPWTLRNATLDDLDDDPGRAGRSASPGRPPAGTGTPPKTGWPSDGPLSRPTIPTR